MAYLLGLTSNDCCCVSSKQRLRWVLPAGRKCAGNKNTIGFLTVTVLRCDTYRIVANCDRQVALFTEYWRQSEQHALLYFNLQFMFIAKVKRQRSVPWTGQRQ